MSVSVQGTGLADNTPVSLRIAASGQIMNATTLSHLEPLRLWPMFSIPRRVAWLALWSVVASVEANPILDWNELLLDAIRTSSSAPTLASRNLAILHTAIYDSVNSIEQTHQPYRFQLEPPPDASSEAAVVGAGFAVSVLLYPEHRATFDGAYARYLNSTPASAALTDGLHLGRLIGQMAVEGRSTDGSSTQVPYIPSDTPGQWRRTPPFYRPPLDPHWGFVDPFCLEDIDAFLPPGPPALDSAAYAADMNQVKAWGGTTSAARTPEQSATAKFWSDFSYTETPPGHWMDIAASVVDSRGNILAETARVCALLALAQADAAIVVWRTKYHYNFWRPVTAINQADEDGNPATDKDETWQSFLLTPPFPEYVSGHSAFSMASAVVLKNFCGTDAVSFAVGSDAVPGVLRTYYSFTDCAHEIGMSRIYGGIHFMSANRDGKACGAKIGQFVFSNFLLPNAELPQLAITLNASGSCSLRLHGHAGRECVLEGSSDMLAWQPVSTNQAVIGGLTIETGNAASPTARFFRLREQ